MFIYCSTKDSPKNVGQTICSANFVEEDKHVWKVKDAGEYFTIETDSKESCVAAIYRIGSFVVGIEVDDNCASKVIEALIEIYGFEKVKWLSAR
ncbi:MAG: hypothetical protein JSW44_00010 [Candidatus Bathyarchaeota archaeon]|nr:MAG: hypothetical protein JSW44_00010 [Candidatus Bathyarchaeota archaeon]